MSDFYNDYFNFKRIREEKHKYERLMARVDALPKDYSFVFKKIQNHMWQFATGAGYDMLQVHADLLDLFEEGAANGKQVLEVTGNDVAAFCEELLRNTKTYTENWRAKLNREIAEEIGKQGKL